MADYIEGEIIVEFKRSVSSGEAILIVKSLGLAVKNRVGSLNMYLVAVPAGSEEKWLKHFRSLAGVNYAQYNSAATMAKTGKPQ